VVNLVWGTYNIETGLPIALAGIGATATVPVIGQLTGIPAAIYGGVKVVSGAAKVQRGFGQAMADCQGDPQGNNLGANGSRFLRGVAPKFGGSLWDTLGGLPIL
jgi:hypothetical protein